MGSAIRTQVAAREISRLCHFTPARNLPYILESADGVLSRRALRHARKEFTATDEKRLDCHDDHISCSVEYPNAWYFRRVKDGDLPFTDWVILYIAPHHLWAPTTLFCPRNAAAGHGTLLRPGPEGFTAMFASTVDGAGGRMFRRAPHQLPCSPTDQQAEVMVERQIPRADIVGVAVRSAERAWDDAERLRAQGISADLVKWVVVPDLFEPRVLDAAIRAGRRPAETNWSLMTVA